MNEYAHGSMNDTEGINDLAQYLREFSDEEITQALQIVRYTYRPRDEFEKEALRRQVARYQQALELIAASERPDGTYNRSREACEQLAREALDNRV
jgi:L-arabinose isomerase